MNLEKQNILMILRATQHAGTENVAIQICKILKPYANKIIICSADGINKNLLDELEIKHYVIPDVEEKNLFTMCHIYRTLRRIVRIEKITTIHTHHRMAAFYARIINIKNSLSVINTSHNTFSDKRLLTEWIYKKVNLIACGEMVKKNLIEIFKLPQDKISVIHNAVEPWDCEQQCIEEFASLKARGYILVGNVGRLSPQKAMDVFINTYKLVEKKATLPFKYVIVGDGELKDDLNEQVKRLGLEDNILFMGYREDIRNVLAQLDFIVLSSLWEGLPLTPIEAFSVKKAVIGTAVDGTVEIIKNGVNGFLVSPNDKDMLAEKIADLINNKEMLKNFESEAYKSYLQLFSFEIFSKKILDYYSGL